MIAKRVLDLLGSIIAMLFTAPLWAVLAMAILLEDGRPVFFRQVRVGRGGEIFRIHKFRTMKVGHGGPNVSALGDGRVTFVGKYLRASKLDELPQLLDVVKGDMSLVGPRPEVPEYVAKWPTAERIDILSVRPGITDPASLEFRNEAGLLAGVSDPGEYYESVLLPQKVRLYVEYVSGRSFVGDILILVRTIVAVSRG
ncbi:sugar transferase [Dietzia sp. B32]|uniref:sugar transferase n=1 Tax=Dietzia sp. B32 TaxID=2915130 RepID=UPI0021AD8923|nr:sugar transferase [Dietzia sp. B32]UVE96430.1 sugar transferase [Dietzia sp. B32]